MTSTILPDQFIVTNATLIKLKPKDGFSPSSNNFVVSYRYPEGNEGTLYVRLDWTQFGLGVMLPTEGQTHYKSKTLRYKFKPNGDPVSQSLKDLLLSVDAWADSTDFRKKIIELVNNGTKKIKIPPSKLKYGKLVRRKGGDDGGDVDEKTDDQDNDSNPPEKDNDTSKNVSDNTDYEYCGLKLLTGYNQESDLIKTKVYLGKTAKTSKLLDIKSLDDLDSYFKYNSDVRLMLKLHKVYYMYVDSTHKYGVTFAIEQMNIKNPPESSENSIRNSNMFSAFEDEEEEEENEDEKTQITEETHTTVTSTNLNPDYKPNEVVNKNKTDEVNEDDEVNENEGEDDDNNTNRWS